MRAVTSGVTIDRAVGVGAGVVIVLGVVTVPVVLDQTERMARDRTTAAGLGRRAGDSVTQR